jgi:hypothetical protein
LSYLPPAGTRFLRRTAKLRPAGVILRPAGTRFLRRTAKPRPAGGICALRARFRASHAKPRPAGGQGFAPYGRIYGRPAGALRASHGHRGEIPKGFAPTRSALTG